MSKGGSSVSLPRAQLDTAANPGARTFLSAAALEANMRADGADRRPGVAADRNVRAPAVVSGCARLPLLVQPAPRSYAPSKA